MLAPLLFLALQAPGVTPDEGALLTSLVAAAAGKDPQVDVLASEDVRKAVALEAEQQMAGCSSEGSCLAELAGALGARAIIYGTVGTLGGLNVLTLNVFDSAAGQSGGRVVVRGKDVEELSRGLDAAVAELLAGWQKGAGRARVLVMDLDVKGGVPADVGPPPAAAEGGGGGALLWSGAAVAGVGAAALVTGVVLDQIAVGIHTEVTDDTGLDAKTANARFDERDGYSLGGTIGLGVGAAALVVGAGLLTASFLE